MNAVEGRIAYLHQQIGYHAKQISILQEELDELEARGEEVPEVEVTESALRNAYGDAGLTYERSPVPVESPERPPEGRRSGAKNVSDPRYQSAFISEARRSMGQPSMEDAEALVGKYVEVVFNIDRPDVRGVLTRVIQHPANTPAYLQLDDEKDLIPLNSVQEIKVVP